MTDGAAIDDAVIASPPPAEVIDLGYTVTTDSFSGPLDLLLFLVRRTEVDIIDIPLMTVIDQFIATVSAWQDMDLEVAGDFVAMAATLLEIKARMVAPLPDSDEPSDEDDELFSPHANLIQSLLAYRRFKEAAQELASLEISAAGRSPRVYHETIPEDPDDTPDLELGEIDSHLLMRTCEIILARINGLGPRTVPIDDIPLTVRIAALIDDMRVRHQATLRDLMAQEIATSARLGTVLATLECTRQRFLELKQLEQYGEVQLRWRDETERSQQPSLPPEEAPPSGKRRRRPPLVTWVSNTERPTPEASDDDDTAVDETQIETDEQRFVREIDELCGLGVLEKTQNVEASFLAHWYELHPELKPPEPVAPEAPPVAAAPTIIAPPKKTRPKPLVLKTNDSDAATAVTTNDNVVVVSAPIESAFATTTTHHPVDDVAIAPIEPPISELPIETAQTTAEILLPESSSIEASLLTTPDLVSPDETRQESTHAIIEEILSAPAVQDTESLSTVTLVPSDTTTQERVNDTVETNTVQILDEKIPEEVARVTDVSDHANVHTTTDVEAPAALVILPNAEIITEDSPQIIASTIGETLGELDPSTVTPPIPDLEAPLCVSTIHESIETDHVMSDLATPSARNHHLSQESLNAAPSHDNAVIVSHEPTLIDDDEDVEDDDEEESSSTWSNDDAHSATQSDLEDVNAALLAEEDPPLPMFIERGSENISTTGLSAADYLASLDAPAPTPVISSPVAIQIPQHIAVSDVVTETVLPAKSCMVSEEAHHDDDSIAIQKPAPSGAITDASVPPAVSIIDEPIANNDSHAVTIPDDVTTPSVAEPAVAKPEAESFVTSDVSPVSSETLSLTDEPTLESIVTNTLPISATDIPEVRDDHRDLAVDKTISPIDDTIAELTHHSNALVDEPSSMTHGDHVEAQVLNENAQHIEPIVEDASQEIVDQTAEISPSEIPSAIISSADDSVCSPTDIPISTEELPVAIKDSANSANVTVENAPVLQAETTSADEKQDDIIPAAAAVDTHHETAQPVAPTLPETSVDIQPLPMVADDTLSNRGAPPSFDAPSVTDVPDDALITAAIQNAPDVLSSPSEIDLDYMTYAHKFRLWRTIALMIAACLGVITTLVMVTWVPRGVLEVIDSPSMGAEIDGRSPIVWRFNLDVAAHTTLAQPIPVPSITPSVAGTWHWQDRRTLAFTPTDIMPAATTFTFHVPQERLSSASGFHLGADVTTVVHTPALAVQACQVETFSADSTIVTITFNHPISSQNIAQTLRVEQNGNTLTAKPVDIDTQSRVRLSISGTGPVDLSLPLGFTGLVGDCGLAQAWTGRVHLGPLLQATEVTARLPGRGPGSLLIHANGDDLSLLSESITVTPTTPYRVVLNAGIAELIGDFIPGTAYHIAVAQRFPEATPSRPLTVYPNASTFDVTMPHRQATVWMHANPHHHAELNVESVNTKALTVSVLADGERVMLSRALAVSDKNQDEISQQTIDTQSLLASLPAGNYWLRIGDGTTSSVASVDKLVVPHDQALAALREWQDQPQVLRHISQPGLRLCVVASIP